MILDMEMNINQYQKILMTPQLDYSLKILKLNNEELLEFIDEEMMINPLLEYKENTDIPNKMIVVDYEMDEEYSRKNNSDNETDYINSIPDTLSLKPSLVQHLMLQLHTIDHSKVMNKICEYLIESIDENGYLQIDIDEVAKALKVTVERVNQGIEIIQGFDPPGIGARNLKECLKIQVARKHIVDPSIIIFIDQYLEWIAENKIPQVAQAMGIDIDEVKKLLDTIKHLDPRPGSGFSLETVRYIKPDIIVTNCNGVFEIAINKELIPALQVNHYYAKLLENKHQLITEEYHYINKHINSASWLIRCIDQRVQTLERVAKAIVEHQTSFFKSGEKYLKPLTLKEIAYDLNLHESTISRAVNGKYLLCQWGTFELKYFFSSKTIKKELGEDGSSATAKYELKKMIEEEDKRHPLSDTALCEGLKEKSIHISRRTVAKYRTQLNIPSMDLRRMF